MKKEEFQQELFEEIMSAIKNGEDPMKVTLDKFETVAMDYANFDPEIQKMYDAHFAVIKELLIHNIEKMEDGILKRKAKRNIRKLNNESYYFEQLISTLTVTKEKDQVLKDADVLIKNQMQVIIDLVSDVAFEEEQSKYFDFLKITLYYYIIEELIVAKHLADQNYTSQAYTHIRSVYETIDLIDLFIKFPEYMELWVNNSDDELIQKGKRKTFMPNKVREKIGTHDTIYEKIYWLLCEIGTHTTYKNINSKIEIILDRDEKEKGKINLKLCGVPFREDIIFCNTMIIQTIMFVFTNLISNYEKSFLDEEIEELIDEQKNSVVEFYSSSIINELSAMGFDVKEFIEFLATNKNS